MPNHPEINTNRLTQTIDIEPNPKRQKDETGD